MDESSYGQYIDRFNNKKQQQEKQELHAVGKISNYTSV